MPGDIHAWAKMATGSMYTHTPRRTFVKTEVRFSHDDVGIHARKFDNTIDWKNTNLATYNTDKEGRKYRTLGSTMTPTLGLIYISCHQNLSIVTCVLLILTGGDKTRSIKQLLLKRIIPVNRERDSSNATK